MTMLNDKFNLVSVLEMLKLHFYEQCMFAYAIYMMLLWSHYNMGSLNKLMACYWPNKCVENSIFPGELIKGVTVSLKCVV